MLRFTFTAYCLPHRCHRFNKMNIVFSPFESIKKSGLLKYTDYVSKTFYEDKKETEIELCLTIYLNNGTGYLEESDNRNYKILTIKDGVVVDCYSD